MKTQRTSSMHRSGTMPFSLPQINKLNIESQTNKLNVKQSRYNQNPNRSSFNISISKARNTKSFVEYKSPFTARVEQQALDQNEYPYTETKSIQKQQSKLKDLLKQFNQETVNILEKYVIDRPVIKERVKKKHQIQQMYFMREKEAQNASNLIMILKHEIDKLQSRCENLKYTSRQQFEHKIRQLKQQKQKIISENKQISRQITLNGLQIVRGKQSLAKQLQYEHFIIDTKRDRLKKQSQAVTAEIASFQTKTQQLNNLAQKYEQQQSYTLKKYQELQKQTQQNQLYQQITKKKKLLQHNKVINQSTNYQLKHKYFQKLKELDDFALKADQFANKIQHCQHMILQSQNTIKQLQKKQPNQQPKSVSIDPNINFTQTNSAQVNLSFD